MDCIYCGKEMQEVKTSLATKCGDYEITINGLKALKCEQCQHQVFDSESVDMIQNLAAGFAESKGKEKPDLLNVEDVAEQLMVSKQTVYNMLKDGRLQAQKVGREWRFHDDDIKRMLQTQTDLSVAARGTKRAESLMDWGTQEERTATITQNQEGEY